MNATRILYLFLIALLSVNTASAKEVKTVDVNNTPDVNVVNTPSVIVENDSQSPVPVSIVGGGGSGGQLIEYQVVGFTTTSTNGAPQANGGVGVTVLGVRAMNLLCKAEVAPNARAASVADYLRTRDMPAVPVGSAWLIASDTRVVFDPSLDHSVAWIAFEAGAPGITGSSSSPVGAMGRMTCGHFQDDSFPSRAPIIVAGTYESIAFGTCVAARPVACAAPVAVPVSAVSP